MSFIDALILGLVQGLTEFIPVSSSGHLLLLDELLGGSVSFEMETLTNIGTLLAAMIYFRKDIQNILLGNGRKIVEPTTLILAIIPVLVVGLVMSVFGIEIFRSVNWAITMLIVVGIAMIFEKYIEQNLDIKSVSRKQGLVVGLLQVLALVPGTSRSAATILAGRFQRLPRQLATKFSFILSIPVVGAAVGLTFLQLIVGDVESIDFGFLIVANIASFGGAILGIHFLLKLLERFSLAGFGFYRIAMAFMLLFLL